MRWVVELKKIFQRAIFAHTPARKAYLTDLLLKKRKRETVRAGFEHASARMCQ